MDRRLLNKLKFHLAKVLERHSDEDWRRIVEVLDALAPQSPDAQTVAVHKRLAKDEGLLRGWTIPGDVQVLLRELEHAAKREPEAAAPSASAEERVAAALRGRTMLLIGGDRRRDAEARLGEAFRAPILWPATREDAPDLYSLEPLIARPEIGVVVLLIRFIRHALNDVADLCERHDKPLARVTAGYNAAQIAAAIHEQCGRRLGL
jgi:hypothetical protein